MSVVQLPVAGGEVRYFEVDGTGTAEDPYRARSTVASGSVSAAIVGGVAVDSLPAEIPTKYDGPSFIGVVGKAGAPLFVSGDCRSNVSVTSRLLTDAPGAGLYLRVVDLVISAGAAMRVDVKTRTTGSLVARVYLTANQTVPLRTLSDRWRSPDQNEELVIETDVAGSVSVLVTTVAVGSPT